MAGNSKGNKLLLLEILQNMTPLGLESLTSENKTHGNSTSAFLELPWKFYFFKIDSCNFHMFFILNSVWIFSGIAHCRRQLQLEFNQSRTLFPMASIIHCSFIPNITSLGPTHNIKSFHSYSRMLVLSK